MLPVLSEKIFLHIQDKHFLKKETTAILSLSLSFSYYTRFLTAENSKRRLLTISFFFSWHALLSRPSQYFSVRSTSAFYRILSKFVDLCRISSTFIEFYRPLANVIDLYRILPDFVEKNFDHKS